VTRDEWTRDLEGRVLALSLALERLREEDMGLVEFLAAMHRIADPDVVVTIIDKMEAAGELERRFPRLVREREEP
jgi:hypothetical protein